MGANFRFVKRFSEISIHDIEQVGGKNASLGEMYQSLTAKNIKVPNGFATTAAAYHYFIQENQLEQKINATLAAINTQKIDELQTAGAKIRQWIIRAELPQLLQQEIILAYNELCQQYGASTDVAIRSSATAEDLPNASFAGQQDTYLNIRGAQNLLISAKHVFASLFTNRAISYRVDQGFDHMNIALSIGVQKMVRADKAASGVMFTIDTESGFKEVIFITAAYGLGENVVQGKVNPDEFFVHKPTLKQGFEPIIKKHLGNKLIKMVYGTDAMAGSSTRDVHVNSSDRNKFCINDKDVMQLAHYALAIEEHYSKAHNKATAMDIEWAKDGDDDQIYIVQARPETVESNKSIQLVHTVYTLQETGKVLLQGKSVGRKIAHGKARVIMNTEQMHELQAGEILVTDITDPDWEPVMKIAAAIITNRGGRTCHAAIVARELGIPAIVGTENATQKITTGQEITVNCALGDIANVYAGLLNFDVHEYPINPNLKTQTRLMLNIANPDLAFQLSQLPADGAGLVRLEFIINHSIAIHPSAILNPDKLDYAIKNKIKHAAQGYSSAKHFYTEKLAQGIATIASAFYPRTAIVRFSDFKSNEYASLLAGTLFEPKEENPMIGFRGASRYAAKQFKDCFKLECEAIKLVRNKMGLKNVKIMLPFVRTVKELKNTLALLQEFGLKPHQDELEVIVMCEIPSNALLAKDFLAYCDGFSIGSNDLTQLTLGVDRDSGLLNEYNEQDPAVYQLMKMAIDACQQHNKYIGICGQAPSDYPAITKWLVQQKIDSISLNPDSFYTMQKTVLEIEQKQKPS